MEHLQSVLRDLADRDMDEPALAAWAGRALLEAPLMGAATALDAVTTLERVLHEEDAPEAAEDVAEKAAEDASMDASPAAVQAAAAVEVADNDGSRRVSMDTALTESPMEAAPKDAMDDMQSTPGDVAPGDVVPSVPIDELDQSDAEADEAAVLEGAIAPPRPIKVVVHMSI